jgi:hypothetical protein
MPHHLLVVSRRHLESVLDEYVRHYNQARPHRGLQLAQPIPRPDIAVGNGDTSSFWILQVRGGATATGAPSRV